MSTGETEKWTWGMHHDSETGETYYSVISPRGWIASHVENHAEAILISQLPQLCQLRYEWAGVINRLARIILDGETDSNNYDYAQEMIDMVLPYLSGDADAGGT